MRTRWIGMAVLLLATSAQAQGDVEWITDGGFDDAAHAAWEFQIYDTSTIAWSSQDADGGVPGSLLFQKKVVEEPNSLRVEQCIDVVPGAEYALSGTVYWPTTSNATDGEPFLSITWQLGPNCTGAAGDPDTSRATIGSPPRDVWTGIGPELVTAPAGVHSGRLYVGVIANTSPGSLEIFEARWDDVSFVPEPGPAAGVAAIGALVVLVRSRSRID
jgi:hypothetical protein